jgi:hypothetical protein
MGTHLANTTGYPTTIPDGVQNQAAVADAQTCVDLCVASSICIGSTWIYNNTASTAVTDYGGICLWYIINPGGSTTLYVKVLPMDYMAGATSAKASVATGSYVKYTGAGANLGVTISNTTAAGLDLCKAACDNNVQCWGFYYNGFCILRKGLEGEGHRSWLHIIGAQVE